MRKARKRPTSEYLREDLLAPGKIKLGFYFEAGKAPRRTPVAVPGWDINQGVRFWLIWGFLVCVVSVFRWLIFVWF